MNTKQSFTNNEVTDGRAVQCSYSSRTARDESTRQLLRQGDELRDSGNYDEAIATYRLVADGNIDREIGQYKIGTVHMRRDDLPAAASWFRQALAVAPDYMEAANNLGITLATKHEFDEAEALYRRVLAAQIDHFEVHINLGNLLRDTHRLMEAAYHYRRAMQVRPDSAMAAGRMGPLLRDLGRTEEAKSALQSALDLDPSYALAWNDLGTCHIDRGDIEAADAAFQKAIGLDHDLLPAWINYALVSNWRTLDREEVFRRHVAVGEHLLQQRGNSTAAPHDNNPEPGRCLRIGFVSGDLRRHSVSYFIEGPLRELDRTKCEVWAYYCRGTEDERTPELRALVDEWRNIAALNDVDAAVAIRRDGIDILVDLAGYTGYTRLGIFARKPAPIQVSWMGYPNTSGLPTIDYRITDGFADPPGTSERYHTEKLALLPDCFLNYQPPHSCPEIGAAAPDASPIRFGSFNTRVKIGAECLELWKAVLDAVPDATLTIKSARGLDDDAGRQELLAHFGAAGIDLGRVEVLASRSGIREHLAAYESIDICLDTFPYHGTTTTCEALWMGVPVITLAGDRHGSRVGVSLLRNASLPELIADSPVQFVEIAKRLVKDRPYLANLRETMRERLLGSPLLDAKGMARKLEDAFRAMWSGYCRGRRPDMMPALSAQHCAVRMRGGFALVVHPDPLQDMTSWIVLEQEDWFEDELGFVRSICMPGWQALDIGASHGVYALALGSSAAERVWAFEPIAEARARLRNSISLNALNHKIQVVAAGLAETPKWATIQAGNHSELSSLHHVPQDANRLEDAWLTTLDEFWFSDRVGDKSSLDFVKLDVEGAELDVIRGGLHVFATHDPLIMFEYRTGSAINSALLDVLRSLGYGIYRHVVGLSCLAPVGAETEDQLDKFQLNLFACKPSRARVLAAQGRLISDTPLQQRPPNPEWAAAIRALPALQGLPSTCWSDFDHDCDYGRAFLSWCGSRQTSLSPAERYYQLARALDHLNTAISHEDFHPAVAILMIRVCADLGMRSLALSYAQSFLEQMDPTEAFPLDRPVVMAYHAFDQRTPGVSFEGLLQQSVVEFFLDRVAHSLCFSKTPRFAVDRALASPERTPRAERAAALCLSRDGDTITLDPSALLFRESPDNLNPRLWEALVQKGALRVVGMDADR